MIDNGMLSELRSNKQSMLWNMRQVFTFREPRDSSVIKMTATGSVEIYSKQESELLILPPRTNWF